MNRTVDTIVITASLSLFLLLAYFSRNAGFPSSLIVLLTGFWLIAANWRSRLKTEEIFYGIAAGLSLFLYLDTFRNRGPSFTDAIFILSLIPFFVSLFRRRGLESYLVALGAVFVAWAFASNWEFPSTFSPFLLFGGVELLQLPFILVFSYLLARGRPAGTGTAAGFLLAGAVIFLTSLEAVNTAALSLNYVAASLVGALFLVVALVWGVSASTEKIAVAVAAVPLLLVVVSLFQQFFTGFLPLPFNRGGIISATILFLFFCWLNGEKLQLRPSALVVAAVLAGFLSMLPYEINRFYHIGSYFETVSRGYEFIGTFLVPWLIVVGASLVSSSVWQRVISALVALYASWQLFYSRLFHHLSGVPYSFFKDLGTPEASWVRQAVFPFLDEIVCALAFIILVVYQFSGRRASSTHD